MVLNRARIYFAQHAHTSASDLSCSVDCATISSNLIPATSFSASSADIPYSILNEG